MSDPGQASGHVARDATNRSPRALHLPTVDARPGREPNLPVRSLYVAGTTDRARGAVECREDAITRRVNFDAPISRQLQSRHAVVLLQELVPSCVAKLGHLCR